jgi:hypothetical protein
MLPSRRRAGRLTVSAGLAVLLAVPLLAASSAATVVRPAAGAPEPPAAAHEGPPASGARDPSPRHHFAGGGPGPAPAPPVRAGLARAGAAAAVSAAPGSTQLGVAVLDRVTGELVLGGRAREPFYTASLSKIVLAVDILDRHRIEGIEVSSADFARLRRALGPSDDGAMNELWTLFDGAGAAERTAARLGLNATAAPENPSKWGEMEVSAADLVRIWRHVLEDMPPGDRNILLASMLAAPSEATDGFDQAFGLLGSVGAGPGAVGVVAKQGWMCCFSRQYYLHSAGAVGAGQRFVVVMLARVPRDPGWEAARAELDAVAAAAVRALG